MTAPAPGLFSITTGCPMRLETPSAAARAMRSFAPPGAKGTIHRIGRSGHSARAAVEAKAARASTAKSARANGRMEFSVSRAFAIIEGVDDAIAAWQHASITFHPRVPGDFHDENLQPTADPGALRARFPHAVGCRGPSRRQAAALREDPGIDLNIVSEDFPAKPGEPKRPPGFLFAYRAERTKKD